MWWTFVSLSSFEDGFWAEVDSDLSVVAAQLEFVVISPVDSGTASGILRVVPGF